MSKPKQRKVVLHMPDEIKYEWGEDTGSPAAIAVVIAGLALLALVVGVLIGVGVR